MNTLDRVMQLASEVSGVPITRLAARSAIDQDLTISGMDQWDLEDALADEFGEFVHDWPWERFAYLSEGTGALWPLELIKQLATWPTRGRFSYPSPYERLELGHIAAVLEKGEWCEP